MTGTTDWRSYALVMAGVQGYALDEAQLERVVAQLELIEGIAAPLLAQQLPPEIEPAPVFKP
ncbi:DUF4089 domain-containing protein [Uliginosibacterium sediminicola]|uniref:DUF4089 domain-containing protein n=1 Tax=Uliginosibacterium sediminicola TaxID=2024550 RepID=A0ABU9YWV3_9RHOO